MHTTKKIKITALLFATLMLTLLCACSSRDISREKTATMMPTMPRTWEYRYGDSPRDAQGKLTWLYDSNITWQTYTFPAASPPKRPKGEQNVWLRVKLPDLPEDELFLYILGFNQSAELYINGEKIYNHGEFDANGKAKFVGYPWHLIPLKRAYSGQYLYVRLWSHHINIGIIGDVRIDKKAKFIHEMYHNSLPNLVVGLIVLMLGTASALMYLRQRNQKEYLYFALHTLVGFYIFSRAPLKYFLWDYAPFWLVAEFLSLIATTLGLAGFIEYVLGPTYKNIMGRYAKVGFIFILATLLLSFISFKNIMKILPFIQMYALLGIIMGIIQIVFAVRRKVRDVWILVAGVLTFVFFATLEILIALGIIFPQLMGKSVLLPIGSGTFVGSLALILINRFAAVYKRVHKLKNQLEKILDGTTQMASTYDPLTAAKTALKLILQESPALSHAHAAFGLLPTAQNNTASFIEIYSLCQKGAITENTTSSKKLTEETPQYQELMKHIQQPSTFLHRPNELFIPLRWGEQSVGLIVIETPKPLKPEEHLQADDLQYMNTLAKSLALSLANMMFLRQAQEKAKIDAELEVAQAVQSSLLPTQLNIPQLEICTFYKPAEKTGGDWFGYYYDEANYCIDFFIADVTGHGFSASLLTGVAFGGVYASEAFLEALSQPMPELSLPEKRLQHIAFTLNELVLHAGHGELLITMLFVNLNLRTGELTFLNAGHNHPYIISTQTGKAKAIPSIGSRLGYCAAPKFATQKKQLNPGDLLFMYTDGLIENAGPSGETFSSRLLGKALECGEKDTRKLHEHIIMQAKNIWQNAPAADDVTSMMIQWKG